ncbi:MAG: 2-amino-4-hydroxy-6-hydroxymethyldihydropteridine diphosphokinase [Burkholderiales bacterium]|nr:2-amino-4-hydroxy-6-hydroxymethyldihydropteridine diphosphokinase [Burkholderiales bacterium]
MEWNRAYVALGSNLSEPKSRVVCAFAELAELPETKLIARSSLYLSAPISSIPQPDYINAVACIKTRLEPFALLESLLAVEQAHGRVRHESDAPRTLDLDILLYNDLVVSEASLTIPHPRMHERRFVLCPLLEIAPDCEIPGIGRVATLLPALSGQILQKMTE